MDNVNQTQSFDSSNLIVFVIKKWKPIALITLAGAIISIIASLVITPKFNSTVILFPATTGSISKALLTETMGSKDHMVFGDEEEVEQMMQILQSDEIRDRIVKKYNLMDHYEIDPESQYPRTNLQKKYNNNISIERTQFMSIRIEVLDKDPKLAAKMADNIANLADTVINNMKRNRAEKALRIVEKKYNELDQEIEKLEKRLHEIRKLGINNYESQAEVFNDAYAVALAEGRTKGARKLEKKLDILSEHGGEYVLVRDRLYMANKRLSELEEKYVQAQVDANQYLPHTYIVEEATVAEKKAYPIRWLIVVVSTFGAFVFSVLLFLILDTFRKTNIK